MTTLASVIRNRRTIREFNGHPVTEQQIIEILETAVWAPYHASKEPWRFILFMGDSRQRLASAVLSTYSQEAREKYGQTLMDKFTVETPAHLIVIMSEESEHARLERPRQWEDAYGATSALIQNIQLLAWEQNIGMVWKTNAYNWDRSFCEAIGVLPGEKVVGTLHLGYYDENKVANGSPRTPVSDLLTLAHL
ncbi:nitroreductase [Paenibacillus psychroresistens]|uniref:Nitroreductase n=1 Tax=Paenibacillus psychroresistens TaxID=1778678 RepID=A0A6B8RVX5_9BACL|nr:nitroreductase [Paenibacillus psychroresistens]QGQ99805.1 nitroreductase [Paenibacillus psychroresistens]